MSRGFLFPPTIVKQQLDISTVKRTEMEHSDQCKRGGEAQQSKISTQTNLVLSTT